MTAANIPSGNNPDNSNKKKIEVPKPAETKSLGPKVEESKETLDKLIHDSRSLASEFISAKRTDIERYADQALEMAQSRLVATIESSLNQLGDSFEKTLNRSRDAMGKFTVDLSKSIQSGFKQIDEKPVLPLLAAIVGGCMLGIFIGSRAKSFSLPSKRHLSDSDKVRKAA